MVTDAKRGAKVYGYYSTPQVYPRLSKAKLWAVQSASCRLKYDKQEFWDRLAAVSGRYAYEVIPEGTPARAHCDVEWLSKDMEPQSYLPCLS